MMRLLLQLGALAPSSRKPNSFSVIARSTFGSRMPRCASAMTFLGDKSCGWVTNFQMQAVARCYEGSRHALNGLKIKSLTSQNECCLQAVIDLARPSSLQGHAFLGIWIFGRCFCCLRSLSFRNLLFGRGGGSGGFCSVDCCCCCSCAGS